MPLLCLGAVGCSEGLNEKPEARGISDVFPALITDFEARSAEQIVETVYAAAGGELWRRPQTLSMDGYAVFYPGGETRKNEHHRMWRVYDAGKQDAHRVDGKVRIESIRGGQALINVAFDGKVTSTSTGPIPASGADNQWSSSFGFGVIRHALDNGYSLQRLPDDLVDGHPAYLIQVIDPAGGSTQFHIAQNNHAILKVGFQTARGWHERVYSDFYSKPDTAWVQPGRVRLYYNGVKSNEVIWTDFTINDSLPDCLFRLPEVPNCRE